MECSFHNLEASVSRPIKYDKLFVLDAALEAFWKLGYAACSMQVLVDATGLSRQSIYNVFGDKDGIFRDVVAHYNKKVAAQCKRLEPPLAGQNDLRAFILESIASQQIYGLGACFIVVTVFSSQALDQKIKPALDAGAETVRIAFTRLMGKAAARGEFAPSVSPENGAAYLYSIMNGLSALAQTGGTKHQLEVTLDLALQTLFPNNGK